MATQGDAPLRLTGIITGPFGNNAIFMAAGDAKPLVVSEGMQVGDFVIRSIDPARSWSKPTAMSAHGRPRVRRGWAGGAVLYRATAHPLLGFSQGA